MKRVQALILAAFAGVVAVGAAGPAGAAGAIADDLMDTRGFVDNGSLPPAASAPSPAGANAPVAIPASAPTLTAAQLDRAVAQLRADPLLPGERKTRSLQFKPWSTEPDEPKKKNDPGRSRSGNWFEAFADWIASASRLLVYGLVLVVVAVALVSARHLLNVQRAARAMSAARRTVSHVRDLDVRPESLPDDIGAAAWALWQRGDAGGALSLLYRGALSKLIHVHGVPVSDSSTEGECLALSRAHVGPTTHAYFGELVHAWLAHTYGGRAPDPRAGQVLCLAFGARMEGGASASGALAAAPAQVPAAPARPATPDDLGFADTEPGA
jgi:hypothetical protein